MFGNKEEKTKIPEPTGICPFLKEKCSSKCALSIETNEGYRCAITEIALNS